MRATHYMLMQWCKQSQKVSVDGKLNTVSILSRVNRMKRILFFLYCCFQLCLCNVHTSNEWNCMVINLIKYSFNFPLAQWLLMLSTFSLAFIPICIMLNQVHYTTLHFTLFWSKFLVNRFHIMDWFIQNRRNKSLNENCNDNTFGCTIKSCSPAKGIN